jgi:protein-S-isoprenylcysteine O-methyltransferase Ste14
MIKLLPPSLVLICVVIMTLSSWLMPLAVVFPAPYNFGGLVPLIFGVMLNVWADQQFRRVGTNVKTFDKPDVLVTDGWFKYSRNPMYLGFALILLGVWVLFGTFAPLLGVLAFVLITDRWYIAYEERALAAQFGRRYLDYKFRTRRWL